MSIAYKSFIIISFLIFTNTLLFARDKLQPKDYVAYLQDEANGLKKDTLMGDYKFVIEYQPREMILLNNYGFVKNLVQRNFNEELKKIPDLVYFRLTIIPNNVSKAANIIAKSVNYFSFDMQKDLMIVCGSGDTLKCISFLYERIYSEQPDHKFLLSFENSKNVDKISFIYNDTHFVNKNIKFDFIEKDIKRIPKLIIK